MEAASGIMWLQNTYNLNIPQMVEGILTSNPEHNQNLDKPRSIHFMSFEDLMHISQVGMEMEDYATATQFFLAAVISYNANKCLFKTRDNSCRPYIFDSLQTRYIAKHNYVLLNQSEIDFDSGKRFPFRITNG